MADGLGLGIRSGKLLQDGSCGGGVGICSGVGVRRIQKVWLARGSHRWSGARSLTALLLLLSSVPSLHGVVWWHKRVIRG